MKVIYRNKIFDLFIVNDKTETGVVLINEFSNYFPYISPNLAS